MRNAEGYVSRSGSSSNGRVCAARLLFSARRGRYSLITMPAKMRANPANSGPVRISPKNSTENVTPNTDSVARNSDAGAGSTCATAKFCSSSAMHEANMAK